MSDGKTTSRLRLLQDADIKDKVVLIRVDHNTVKKNRIKDFGKKSGFVNSDSIVSRS